MVEIKEALWLEHLEIAGLRPDRTFLWNYVDRFEWKVRKAYKLPFLDTDGTIRLREIPEGYYTDLASIPSWALWRYRAHSFDPRISVGHDKDYTEHFFEKNIKSPPWLDGYRGHAKQRADSTFRDRMRWSRENPELFPDFNPVPWTKKAEREFYWACAIGGGSVWREHDMKVVMEERAKAFGKENAFLYLPGLCRHMRAPDGSLIRPEGIN